MRINRHSAGACAAIITVAFATAAAQSPGRWLMQKGAPVPTPEEEYWNATANGKLYLMGGNQGGKNDRVLEYDIAADRWTTKKSAPWSANHMGVGRELDRRRSRSGSHLSASDSRDRS